MRVLRAVLVALLVIGVSLAIDVAAGGHRPPATPRPGPRARAMLAVAQSPYGLDGFNAAALNEIHRREQVAAFFAELARQQAERDAAAVAAAARARAAASRPRTSGSPITGDCQAMKPAGFPDWIIQRESRGDPNARNPSGAYGCAQLMPGTGGSGTYAERWARTWAGGAGACNWQPPNYCAG